MIYAGKSLTHSIFRECYGTLLHTISTSHASPLTLREVDAQRASFEEKKSSYEIMELNGNLAAGHATGSFQAEAKKKKKKTSADFKAISGVGPRN